MKPSWMRRPGLGPCWYYSMLLSQVTAYTNRCFPTPIHFVFLCQVLFYFAFCGSVRFVRQRKKSFGWIQVFISAEDSSTAFVKLSRCIKSLCFWLTVVASKSINSQKHRREYFLFSERSRIWCIEPMLRRVLFATAGWEFTFRLMLCVIQHATVKQRGHASLHSRVD